jgi:hypothetical protein
MIVVGCGSASEQAVQPNSSIGIPGSWGKLLKGLVKMALEARDRSWVSGLVPRGAPLRYRRGSDEFVTGAWYAC